jgi:hypothetical protein
VPRSSSAWAGILTFTFHERDPGLEYDTLLAWRLEC